jgi:hypothetical protein
MRSRRGVRQEAAELVQAAVQRGTGQAVAAAVAADKERPQAGRAGRARGLHAGAGGQARPGAAP